MLEPKSETRRCSRANQAKALAVILREEFGVPFAFYDVQTGTAVPAADAEPWEDDDAAGSHLELAAVHQLATDGRARVTLLAGGRFQLALLLYEVRKPALVAAGE